MAISKPSADRLMKGQLIELLHFMKLNRLVEERLTHLYRQNKVVGGLYRSLGQEACSVGAAYALADDDVFTPLIRNLGAIFVRGGRPRDIFCQYMARRDGPTRGRDLNTHFGWMEPGQGRKGRLISVISMLGDMVGILAGAALAERLQGRDTVALTWVGDGATSTGAFHEGFNFACVQKVPLVLVVENNQWAYSTPTTMQTANTRFVDRATAYGCPGVQVDGNDVVAVYEATRLAVERARQGGGPTLIEAETMRMRGHAEHDDMKYVPKELVERWAARDPIATFESQLLRTGTLSQPELDGLNLGLERFLEQELEAAEASPFPDGPSALPGVYGDREVEEPTPPLVREWLSRAGRG